MISIKFLCSLQTITILVLGLGLVELSAGWQSVNILGVHIEWENQGEQTEFHVTSQLLQLADPSDAWLAIGLNAQPKMTGANAVICRSLDSKASVNHYVNRGMYLPPDLIDPNQPALGLSSSRIANVHNQDARLNVSCGFRRDNSNPASGYIQVDESSKLYLIVAFGPGDVGYHGQNKQASETPVEFPVSSSLASSTRTNSADSSNTTLNPAQTGLYQLFLDLFNWLMSFLFRVTNNINI